MVDNSVGRGTEDSSYTRRLENLEGQVWKKLLKPINPYRWNIRRLAQGKTLDVGCGIGRNLRYMGRRDVVGVDHNPDSVQFVRQLGFEAYEPDEFGAKYSGQQNFDTILVSHVLEHLDVEDARELLLSYIRFLKKGGRVIVICPQEKGYESDQTHATYFDVERLSALMAEVDLSVTSTSSFPFPSSFGKKFIYNEHVVLATK